MWAKNVIIRTMGTGIAVLVIGLLSACDNSEETHASHANHAEHGSQDLYLSEVPLHTNRMPAPEISAGGWVGEEVQLQKSRGKVILLDFWATWCPPCRAYLPHTESTWKKYRDKGLVVVGVHDTMGSKGAAGYMKEHNFTFPTGLDDGRTSQAYNVVAIPTYYLIDKEGNIAWGPEHAPPTNEIIEMLL